VDDEDRGDRFGTITSFDVATGVLVVRAATGRDLTGRVTDKTEIERAHVGRDAGASRTDRQHGDDDGDDHGDDHGDDQGDDQGHDDGATADLVAGAVVAEIEVDRRTGQVEEIELG
jgi:hypothetical protein